MIVVQETTSYETERGKPMPSTNHAVLQAYLTASFLRRNRIKMTEPPLLTVEILSPTQSLDGLTRKAYEYLDAGARSCWIAQPILEAIVVLVPGEKPVVHTSGDVKDSQTGITVNVEEICRPFH